MKNMAADVKETKTKLARALELQAKVAALKDEAKAEALETANQAVKDLSELGFVYRLVEEAEYQKLTQPAPTMPATRSKSPAAKSSAPKLAPGPSANYNPDKHCDTCHEQGHDGRAHRTHKDKFTNDELKERGLLPPEIAAA